MNAAAIEKIAEKNEHKNCQFSIKTNGRGELLRELRKQIEIRIYFGK